MLEFEEYKVKLNNAKPGLEDLRGALKLESAQKEIEELEAASEREGFWNDVEKSQKVQKRLKTLKNKVENFQKLCAAWDDMYTICEMAIEENDDSMLEELESEYKQFTEKAEACTWEPAKHSSASSEVVSITVTSTVPVFSSASCTEKSSGNCV